MFSDVTEGSRLSDRPVGCFVNLTCLSPQLLTMVRDQKERRMAGAHWQSGLNFGKPTPRHGASTRPRSGRVCSEPGCATILSTYNADSVCWLHTEPLRKPPLSNA